MEYLDKLSKGDVSLLWDIVEVSVTASEREANVRLSQGWHLLAVSAGETIIFGLGRPAGVESKPYSDPSMPPFID